jgi:hypothetical protein
MMECLIAVGGRCGDGEGGGVKKRDRDGHEKRC